MILQVLADARQLVHDANPVRLEQVLRTDA